MNSLRSRLILVTTGVLWLLIFSRPELHFQRYVRLPAYACALLVTLYLLLPSREPGAEDSAFFGPLTVFANLLFLVLVILGVMKSVPSGALFLMLLVLAQILLFFFLGVAYKVSSEHLREQSTGLLNEKTQQLLYLQQVGIAMNTSEEIRSFLDIVLSATSHITKAERVLLFLEDESGNLSYEAGHNVEGFETEIINVLRHEITTKVHKEGLNYIYPAPRRDAGEAASLMAEVRIPGAEEADSLCMEKGSPFMALPLIRKDGCWGVFYAEGSLSDDLKFSATDLEVFRVLASQISVPLENADLYFQMRKTYRKTVEALAAAIEAKDAYTHGHSSAVTRYAVPVGREMGLTGNELESVEFAAILHDIGKIAVAESVLNKPGKLTREEFEDIKKHPTVGAEIIKSVGFLSDAVSFIRHHHERWDGKGYPDGLKGDEIPVGAQIIGIVDTFDAMTSTRSYRKALSTEEAIKEIQRCSGSQFNPAVVKVFMRAYKDGLIATDEERAEYTFTERGSYKTDGEGDN